MQQNLSLQDALDLIQSHIPPFDAARPASTEAVPLLQSPRRVLARDIASPLDLPPFDNSAVDGYALRAHDIDTATEHAPLALLCPRTIAAAPSACSGLELIEPSQCARIMTGAPLPPGADAIVMREDVDEREAGRIRFATSTYKGQNIRRRGEDIQRGEVAVHAGTRLRPSEVALLAACGLPDIEVARRPRVAIIATGDELAEPGHALGAGQIYNSNAFALEALCHECGADVIRRERAGDDAPKLAQMMLDMARTCDVLLTSGGVSAGDFDPVRDVLLGAPGLPAIARPHFWKASIKPGKPILFATMNAIGPGLDSPRVPIFALPGNPVSVAVTFELFVRPALLRLQGAPWQRLSVRARVDGEGYSPRGKAEFVRAFVSRDEDLPGSNTWTARVTGAQGSGRLTTMARANALLVIPESVSRYSAGDEFEARLLD